MFGADVVAARNHFVNWGYNEGRPLSPGASSAADPVDGDAAANLLSGGQGADTLNSGYGSNRLVFDTPLDAASNLDHVVDFTHGVDKLVLANMIFTQRVNPVHWAPLASLSTHRVWHRMRTTSSSTAERRACLSTMPTATAPAPPLPSPASPRWQR